MAIRLDFTYNVAEVLLAWGIKSGVIFISMCICIVACLCIWICVTWLSAVVVIKFQSPVIRYECPSVDELERYSVEYKKRLDEVGALGEIPDDLGLEVINGWLFLAAVFVTWLVESKEDVFGWIRYRLLVQKGYWRYQMTCVGLKTCHWEYVM